MINNKYTLNDIADITTGLVLKRKQATADTAQIREYKVLTLKSFVPDGYLDSDALDDFGSAHILNDKYLTQEGDIIVRLSAPHTSITINSNQIGYVIPSLFVVIRLQTREISPDYLSIYLNSCSVQKHYTRHSIGTAIQIIKTSMLRDITISCPSLEKQKNAVELNNLMTKESILIQQLYDEKQQYHKAILHKLLEEK